MSGFSELRRANVANQRFGKLLALRPDHRDANGNWLWKCQCDCGNLCNIKAAVLRAGRQKSCGQCRNFDWLRTHEETRGHKDTPEYSAFRHAKQRCNNPRHALYSYYGGRGIEFRFTSFEQFLKEIGRRPSPDLSLDRINNNGHYEPGNVRWATRTEQQRNRRMPKRPCSEPGKEEKIQ